MRTRFLTVGTAMAVALGLLTATPASATYSVESITFPDGDAEFYSPFSGPASIKFTFNGTENNATFNVRLRPAGGTAIHTQDVFVTPDEPGLFEVERFSWPALSVNSPRTYVVAVYRSGRQVASDSFFVRPRLVSITNTAPDPFLPWIDDGFKDITNIEFDLAADAGVEAHVFRPDGVGNCCGNRVRSHSIGSLPAGSGSWAWDGRNDNGDNLGKGEYFVRIRGEDLANVVRWSKPSEVSIARTYRATETKSKPAKAYHHVGPSTPLIFSGSCIVYVRDEELRILCQAARVTAFWRWGLDSNERIEKASFVIDNAGTNDCPPSVRSKGYSKHESWFTVRDVLEGAWALCRVSTAKITFSYPKAS
jgi:FlgD Ig-like domain